MNPSTNSEISANHVYSILLRGKKVLSLKFLLRDIEEDYDNSNCTYILRQCKNVKHLGDFLRQYSHLFIVENNKVAKYCDKIETGKETAERYFEELLAQCNRPVSVEKLSESAESASEEIQLFIQTFYPGAEFKHFLQRRPHLFHVSPEKDVCLLGRVCAEFFKKIVRQQEGVLFMSLRGRVSQAPDHIRKYINNQYPGPEFRHFLENYCDMFQFNSNGQVFLVK